MFDSKSSPPGGGKPPSRATSASIHLREGRLTITPDDANHIVTTMNYTGQRNVNNGRVELFADAMKHGDWADGMQINFARLDGRLILVNGQHRLHAVVRANISLEFVITIHECETEDEVGKLYYRFDKNLGIRTMADAIRSTGAASKHDMCSDRDAYCVTAAVKVIAANFRALAGNDKARYLANPDRLFAAANPWWDEGRTYLSLVNAADGKLKKRLMRQGVMAVGMMTVANQLDCARTFWQGVAEDDGLSKRDPRHALVRYLREELNSFDNRLVHQMRGAAACWNAFYENRDLLLVRIDVDKQLVIKGTPIGRNSQKKK